MALPTGSRLGRAFECVGSAVLSRISEDSVYGVAGRWKHDFARAVKEGKPIEEALAAVPAEFREACLSLDSAVLEQLVELEAEVPFTYDVKTHVTRRDLDPTQGGFDTIYNRIDFAGVVDAVACVVDIKTGFKDVEPAERNWQLREACVALAAEKGLSQGRGAILYLREGQRAKWDIAEYDAMQLDADVLELEQLAERISWARRKGEQPPLRMGEWCKQCPSRLYCPAHTALIRAFVKDEVAAALELKNLLTPATAREAKAKLELVRAACKNMEQALYAFARETPIPLGDGKLWGPHSVQRDVVDGAQCYQVLNETYGLDVAMAASSFEVTKERIYEAMRGVQQAEIDAGGKKRSLAELEREAIARLRAAGAITKVEKEVFEEYRPLEATNNPTEAF